MFVIIAVALFVHYMMSHSTYEYFQEGATASSSPSADKVLDDNEKKFRAAMRKEFVVQDRKSKKMGPVADQIKTDVAELSQESFKKIVKNGNIQLKEPEYQTLKKKVERYIPVTNSAPKNPQLKDFPKIRGENIKLAGNLLNVLLQKRDLSQAKSASKSNK